VDRAILPVHKAQKSDPANIFPLLDLAYWYGEKWKLAPNLEIRNQAALFADVATKLDPEGKDGYLAAYRLNLLFAQFSQTGTKTFYDFAVNAMRQVVRRDPTEVRLRYQLAEVLFQAGNEADGKLQAEEALRLDQLATQPTRKLTNPQREQIQKWLAGTP